MPSLKAPSECPILVLRYAELLNEAGFPAGVVQALSGPGASMGQWLVANNLIDAVTLTGSTGVGSKILEYSAPYFHRTLLELGGNDPLIITDGVDIDEAVAQSMCRVGHRPARYAASPSASLLITPSKTSTSKSSPQLYQQYAWATP